MPATAFGAGQAARHGVGAGVASVLKREEEPGTQIGHLTLVPGSGLDRAAKALAGFKDRYNAQPTAPKIISPDNPRSFMFTPPSRGVTGGAAPASAAPAAPATPAATLTAATPEAQAPMPAASPAVPAPTFGGVPGPAGSGSFATAAPGAVVGQFNGRDITKAQAEGYDARLPTSAAGWPVMAGPGGGVAFTPSTKFGPAATAGAAEGATAGTPAPASPTLAPGTQASAGAATPSAPAAPEQGAAAGTGGSPAPATSGPAPRTGGAPTFAANLPGQGGEAGGGGLGGGGPAQVDTSRVRAAEAERAAARTAIDRQRGLMELRSQGLNSRGKRQLYADLTGQSASLTKQRGDLAQADVNNQRQSATTQGVAANAQAGANQRNAANNQTQRDLAQKALDADGKRINRVLTGEGGTTATLRNDGSLAPVTGADGQPFRQPTLSPGDRLGYLGRQIAALSSDMAQNPYFGPEGTADPRASALALLQQQADAILQPQAAATLQRGSMP